MIRKEGIENVWARIRPAARRRALPHRPSECRSTRRIVRFGDGVGCTSRRGRRGVAQEVKADYGFHVAAVRTT
jgi:hypothetical protein